MKKNTFIYLMAVLAVAGIIYSITAFDKAFPLVNVQITADKNEIMNKADSLTRSLSLLEGEFRSVVGFESNEKFKNYVELEGGGVDVFQEIIGEGIYYPYSWLVRQFKVNDIPEIQYVFSPDGQLLGFKQILPDSLSGRDIADFDIREIFLRSDAKAGLLPDISEYDLIEESSELKEGGRRDHVFTFEHRNAGVADAQYRLKIGISGDDISMILPEVKIPEAFEHRFEEMRSANNTISYIGLAVMVIVYGLIGVGISLFFMIRRKTLIWRSPLKWAIIIGAAMFLAYLTTISMSWFAYDTSLSVNQFIFQQVLIALINGLLTAVLFFVSAMAAEGLDRQAFPSHIRFWSSWSPTVGASREIMRQTVFGYLWAFFMIGFITFFYWVTNNVFNWWSPAENIMDPNILALPLPWLLPSAISLNAGFWEECLFRAVPLAGAVLIGKNFRKKGLWIAFALVFQAVIFGALHANYAQQPAYARIVEMLIPFVLYGLIYINWGLLPVVISHFIYDIILMSMPLFLLSAPGVWVHRILAILVALIPLLVVVYMRVRAGGWYELKKEDLNQGYKEPEKEVSQKKESVSASGILEQKNKPFPLAAAITLLIGGAALWALFTSFEQDVPKLDVNRKKALLIADAFVEQRYSSTDTLDFKPYVRIESGIGRRDLFAWEHSDRETFRELYANTLASNYYQINYKTFEGDLERRSETLSIQVGRDGEILGWYHHVPEARPGASLSEAEARKLAEKEIGRHFRIQTEELEAVQVTPEKQKARTDWKFIYRDINTGLLEGDVRYVVHISGDEVSGVRTDVHMTESWERDQKKKSILRGVLSGISTAIRLGMFITILIMGIIAWTRQMFNVKVFLIILSAFILMNLLDGGLNINAMFSQFPTSEPFINLVLITVIGLILGSLFSGFIYGIIAGYIARFPLMLERNENMFTMKGVGVGMSLAAVMALAAGSIFGGSPVIIAPKVLDSSLPLLSSLVSGIQGYFILLFQIFAPMIIAERLWKKSRIGALIILFVSGFIFAGKLAPEWWVLGGAVAGMTLMALYSFVLRYNMLYIPVIAAVVKILDASRYILADPAVLSLPDSLIRIVIYIAAGVISVWGLYKLHLEKQKI